MPIANPRYPEAVVPDKQVIVYICPSEDCPDYFGATEFRSDITPEINDVQEHRSQNDGSLVLSHTRTECPLCRARGRKVERVAYIVTQVVPLNEMVSAFAQERDKRAKMAAKRAKLAA